ncbi:hypothetical protein CC2G_003277 [Coprinopsis cinerea AmutBmut pab1-1]|nr:hypothetical protein CC2G_003277 [Coprinopsis cinerea AmutBmut pab1-1]
MSRAGQAAFWVLTAPVAATGEVIKRPATRLSKSTGVVSGQSKGMFRSLHHPAQSLPTQPALCLKLEPPFSLPLYLARSFETSAPTVVPAGLQPRFGNNCASTAGIALKPQLRNLTCSPTSLSISLHTPFVALPLSSPRRPHASRFPLDLTITDGVNLKLIISIPTFLIARANDNYIRAHRSTLHDSHINQPDTRIFRYPAGPPYNFLRAFERVLEESISTVFQSNSGSQDLSSFQPHVSGSTYTLSFIFPCKAIYLQKTKDSSLTIIFGLITITFVE